jgi:hypothetical protein
MKKIFILLLLFIVTCGSSEGETVTEVTKTNVIKDTTTTTVNATTTTPPKKECVLDSELRFKVAVFDDSEKKPYKNIYFKKPDGKSAHKLDLSYGGDYYKTVCIGMDEFGFVSFSYDTDKKFEDLAYEDWYSFCFQRNTDDKGDISNIWIIFNDDIIEIEGIFVRDRAILRDTGITFWGVEDNSFPEYPYNDEGKPMFAGCGQEYDT